MFRLTPVVKNIIIINVIIFIAQQFLPVRDFASCFGNYPYEYKQDLITGFLALWNVKTDCFKPYQLFTYMFLHGGASHIFMNMLSLAFMGPILESFWGAKRFTIFYTVTGIGAAVFNILVDLYLGVGTFGTMVGASGAIYGLLMAIGMLFPNMEMSLLFPPVTIKAKYFVLILGGITFFMSFRGGQSIAHLAHLGGIVFAFLLITIWRLQGKGGSHY
jgi:membrane associated rhomboid family serine protease